jgi:hypothetical protein
MGGLVRNPTLFLLLSGAILLASRWFPDQIIFPLQLANTSHPDAGIAVISREGMQITISVIVLLASLYMILSSKYGPKDKHWAYGVVGTIIGFWFK